ncbi:hypothetical protein [Streptomyces yangpuensis]
MRQELFNWGDRPPVHVLVGLADHEDPLFRLAACQGAWNELPDGARQRLLNDEDREVRLEAAEQVCPEDEERTAWLIGELDGSWRLSDVLRTGRLTRELAERLLAESDRRATIAGNPSLPPDLVARLAVDPDPAVRLVVSARPELSEADRAAIDHTVNAEARLGTLDWVWERREDADFLRQCARSAHTWLRRSAAAPQPARACRPTPSICSRGTPTSPSGCCSRSSTRRRRRSCSSTSTSTAPTAPSAC